MINSFKLYKKKVLNSYFSLRKNPKNLKNKDLYLFSNEIKKKIPTSYILKTKNRYIYNLSILNKKGNNIYIDYTLMVKQSVKNKIKKYLNKADVNKLNESELVDKASWITDEKSNRFFHWFTDTLMRFILISRDKEASPILIHEDLLSNSYIKESIEILKIKHKTYKRNQLLNVNNLEITSHVADSGNYHTEAINEIRNQFTKNLFTKNPSKRLWITRINSDYRRIENQEALLPILKKYKFEIIKPEEKNLVKNIKLFNSARVIGGLHGAGLTNMLFMQENTSIIEVRREEDSHNNCYFSLASDLNINYFYVNADSNTLDFFNSDCKLDPEKLESLLSDYSDNLFG